MNFEPQKFFIGLIDFFSIFLPGAVLTFLLKADLGPMLLPNIYYSLQGTQAGLVFLFTSYLLGHFLFLVASLLDEYAYEPIRKATDGEQITRLLNGRPLSPRLLRWLARVCFKTRPDAAVNRVVQIKEGYLKRIQAPGAVNAFQWSKAQLALEHPEALATVNRFEADSKFFRSFVPVLLVFLGMQLYRNQWDLAAGAAVFLGLAFWRYMEQRFKATQQAYWYILTLQASQAAKTPDSNQPGQSSAAGAGPDSPTHAGGVVFRRRSGRIEYLLVQASKKPAEWVLPKGHIEPGEALDHTALREVREETGVWARIIQPLKVSKFDSEDKPARTLFYLMQMEDEGKPEEAWRARKWLALDEALSQTPYNESKDLLELADRQVLRPGL